ncbi:MAG: VOC family protein [Candidatus Eremiobacteraeota bacterium]|nr:VOC family protein [Candidatus Eremiobacteraeota bacterium]MBV8222290.1 VOC family protein [Candidatus Eremiobacteraeota bacterium]MBV8282506.1 VOC family protein [Candidatus Eremiobacteraeota bacterium]
MSLPFAYSHVDLRVSDRANAMAFYDDILGLLGLHRGETKPEHEWISYSRHDGTEQWFAFTQAAKVKPGDGRVAFAAPSREVVDQVAALLPRLGARNVEGPEEAYGPDYYAVFFEDPDGNKLEVCCID